MEESKRGGYRPNAGRPTNNRSVMVSVRISQEAADKLNKLTKNKSEFINNLILEQPD